MNYDNRAEPGNDHEREEYQREQIDNRLGEVKYDVMGGDVIIDILPDISEPDPDIAAMQERLEPMDNPGPDQECINEVTEAIRQFQHDK